MEGRRPLDSAGRPRGKHPLMRQALALFAQPLKGMTARQEERRQMRALRAILYLGAALFLLGGSATLSAQPASAANSTTQEIHILAAGQHWQELVLLLGPLPARTAEMDFYYGTALARLERWSQAESAFEAGIKLAPRDPQVSHRTRGCSFPREELCPCRSPPAAGDRTEPERRLRRRLPWNGVLSRRES